jgi:hypothetical protein
MGAVLRQFHLDHVLGQPQARHHVVAIERLLGVVEDVQHVVLGVGQHQVQRVEPATSEVLAFVDDDRVVPATNH